MTPRFNIVVQLIRQHGPLKHLVFSPAFPEMRFGRAKPLRNDIASADQTLTLTSIQSDCQSSNRRSDDTWRYIAVLPNRVVSCLPMPPLKTLTDAFDSQSVIVGCYVIIFGAGTLTVYVHSPFLSLMLTAGSYTVAGIPDSLVHVPMGTIPLQLPWTRYL